MGFNRNQAYRWVSQPKQFPGQQLEWNNAPTSTIKPPIHEANVAHSRFKLIQTAIQQFRQQLQNS